MKINRIIVSLAAIAVTGFMAEAQSTIHGVHMDQVTPIPLTRFFGMKQWEFTIADTNLTHCRAGE